MDVLLALSIALISGLLLSRLAKLLQLPAVTAYLITGILIGPYCLGAFGVKGLGFISHANVKSFSIICDGVHVPSENTEWVWRSQYFFMD